jgi:hypothetical protein
VRRPSQGSHRGAQQPTGIDSKSLAPAPTTPAPDALLRRPIAQWAQLEIHSLRGSSSGRMMPPFAPIGDWVSMSTGQRGLPDSEVIEEDCKFTGPRCRCPRRSLPLLDAFDEWVNGIHPKLLPKSPLRQATTYALNQRAFFRLRDISCEAMNRAADAVHRCVELFLSPASDDNLRASCTGKAGNACEASNDPPDYSA